MLRMTRSSMFSSLIVVVRRKGSPLSNTETYVPYTRTGKMSAVSTPERVHRVDISHDCQSGSSLVERRAQCLHKFSRISCVIQVWIDPALLRTSKNGPLCLELCGKTLRIGNNVDKTVSAATCETADLLGCLLCTDASEP